MTSHPPPPRVVVVVGPTAVGKTALAVALAERFGGEIVSADSRQIYRHMDIGTAKPSPNERARARHHLVDIVDPDQELTLAHYQRLAMEAIASIWSHGSLPLFVGGTGLYVRSVLEGWTIPEVPPQPELRQQLRNLAVQQGHDALHTQLAAIDPLSAERIDPRNVRRVIRAIEVYRKTGQPISSLQRKRPPGYRTLKLGLTMPREQLYERVDGRIDMMTERGLVREVRWLLAQGYARDLPAMSALGYAEIVAHLKDSLPLEEAIAAIRRNTRRFVRQQYNWFRLSDASIHWLDAGPEAINQAVALLETFLPSTFMHTV